MRGEGVGTSSLRPHTGVCSRALDVHGPHLIGIVTRCPLVLKLRKLNQGEEWRGKVTYDDIEVELSDPSQVEEAINKGQYLIFPLSPDCQHCVLSPRRNAESFCQDLVSFKAAVTQDPCTEETSNFFSVAMAQFLTECLTGGFTFYPGIRGFCLLSKDLFL